MIARLLRAAFQSSNHVRLIGRAFAGGWVSPQSLDDLIHRGRLTGLGPAVTRRGVTDRIRAQVSAIQRWVGGVKFEWVGPGALLSTPSGHILAAMAPAASALRKIVTAPTTISQIRCL